MLRCTAMSDLSSIVNVSDLRNALHAGSLERLDVQAVDLPPTDAGRVQMNHVRFTGTKLVGLHLAGLEAARVQCRGVILRGTRFEHAELRNWDVSASHAQEIQWPAARMYDCRFTETPLTNANLGRALLVGCEFAMADLNQANLSESLIIQSKFTDTRQGGAVLDNANLSGAVLSGVSLRGANLFRANFTGAVLIGVDLRDANLVGVSFKDAVLIDVKTERAEMAGSTITEIQMAGTSLLDVFERLRHLPVEHTALVAAAALLRGNQTTAATPGAATSGQLDPLTVLLRLSFPAMVRELQGRGGPPELANLRVDGDHVFARGVSGEEIRLTGAERAAVRQAPQMRDPLPSPAATPSRPAAAPAQPAAAPRPGDGRYGGLEID